MYILDIGIGMHTRALMENDKWHVNSRAKWVSPEMTKKTLLATGEHSRGTDVSTNPAYSRFPLYKNSWILMVCPYFLSSLSLGKVFKKCEISIFKLTFIDQIISLSNIKIGQVILLTTISFSSYEQPILRNTNINVNVSYYFIISWAIVIIPT